MPDILHRLKILAPPESVYRALTEQQGLSRWATPEAAAEPHVGSIARFGLEGRGMVLDMIVKLLDPPRRVRWRCIGGHPEWTGTEVGFDLAGEAGVTVLLLGHRGWKSADGELPDWSHAWACALSRLKALLESAPPAA